MSEFLLKETAKMCFGLKARDKSVQLFIMPKAKGHAILKRRNRAMNYLAKCMPSVM